MLKLVLLWLGLAICGLPVTVHPFQLLLGNCPVYYEERCDSGAVQFTWSVPGSNGPSIHKLNPYAPNIPSDYNVLVPLKILVHGYGGLSVETATTNVSSAYEDVGYNVITVDWGFLSSLPCYATAYLNTWHVGQCLSILAINLIPFGISPYFIHVVGFSLGAHIAGFAGNHLKNVLGYSFGRITGLDPALPFFATLNNERKLDPSDAYFVDVVHTSAGTFGKLEACGHADFYVNGGSLQPFCYEARYPPICSHILAGLYFAESIRNNDNAYVGIRCENAASYFLGLCHSGETAIMGEYIDHTSRGIYYVKTADTPPFALNYI